MYRGFLFFLLFFTTAPLPAAASDPKAPACGIFSALYRPSVASPIHDYSLTIEKEKLSLVYPGSTQAYFKIRKQSRESAAPRTVEMAIPYGCTASGHIACGLRLRSMARIAALNGRFEEVTLLDESAAPAAIVIPELNNIIFYTPEQEITKLTRTETSYAEAVGNSGAINIWIFDRCLEP
ncbi:MAG: hypothetical protein Q8K65_01470 [Alphaproteobacteria bacterium]|nr:hypothetical protein [Alphaproteobacteria bacterium]